LFWLWLYFVRKVRATNRKPGTCLTPLRIAEAVLVPVYGKKQIESERPFTATLKGEVWAVGGTLHCSDGKGGDTTFCAGGVAVVKISKSDGRILYMMHGK
jgi:hypothetical protein